MHAVRRESPTNTFTDKHAWMQAVQRRGTAGVPGERREHTAIVVNVHQHRLSAGGRAQLSGERRAPGHHESGGSSGCKAGLGAEPHTHTHTQGFDWLACRKYVQGGIKGRRS